MYLRLATNSPHPEFDVYDNNKLIMRIKIDKETQAFRIKLNDYRRVFLLVEEKYRKNSICTLVNEYSQPLGSITKNKMKANTGEIEIEGLKLKYKLALNPFKEIILLEDDTPGTLLNCTIQDELSLSVNEEYLEYFLFALSWFAFSTKESKEVAAFAEA